MKVTIDFDEEIQPAIQQHLDGGVPVQRYVIAAVAYFNKMLEAERKGNCCGYGDKSRFKQYNTESSPSEYLSSF